MKDPIQQFKRNASRLKKKSGGKLTHSQALEQLSREKGYSDWHECRESLSQNIGQ